MSPAHEPTADDTFLIDLDAQSLRSRTIRGSLVTAVVQVSKMILQLGSTVILGRLLFPADFGLVAMVYPIIGFVQLFGNLGFGEAIVQRRTISRADVSALFWLNLAIGGALAIVGAGLSPLAAWVYGDGRVVLLMSAVAALLPLSALSSTPIAILSRQMRFGTIARNDLAATFVGITATVVVALLGWSYWSLVFGQFVSTATSNVLTWFSVRWLPSRPALTGNFWNDVKFGTNITGANIATFITSSGDNVIIGAFNGKTALGIYDRSYRLVVQPLGQMLAPISTVALPHLSRLQDQPDAYRSAYLDFVRVILLLTVPMMILCTLNAHFLVFLLLGPHWTAAAKTFSWISVGGLLSGFYSSLTWLFISQAKTALMRRYMSIAAVFNIVSFLIGTIWGVEGVAACAAIVFILVSVPMVTYGATLSGPVGLRDIVACALPYVIAGLAAAALAIGLRRLLAGNNYAVVLASCCAIYGCYLVMALVRPREREMIVFSLAQIRSRLRPISNVAQD
ncbi:MAG: lipopolysaccharide biosynthesis protein [Janthinobacterium lividum]